MSQAGPRPPLLMVGNFLSRANHPPTMGEALQAQLEPMGFPIRTTSGVMNKALRLFDMLRSILLWRRDFQLVVTEIFSGPAFLWAEATTYLLGWLGKPVVLWLHGGNLPAFARANPGRVRRLLSAGARVVAPSGYLRHHLGEYRGDIEVLPNGLDLSGYRFRLREGVAPNLVWLRSFHPIYRPEMALEVVRLLREDYPAVRLSMYGPDKDGTQDFLRQRAGQQGLEEQVSFPGRVPKAEVPDAIQSGDVFLNTTDVDNTPVSVIEAMACGACVVSTSVGGIPFLLEHEEDALLVPAGDAEAMAASVRRLVEDPDLAARLSRKAREKAETFDWSRVLPRWEALLGELADEGSRS